MTSLALNGIASSASTSYIKGMRNTIGSRAKKLSPFHSCRSRCGQRISIPAATSVEEIELYAGFVKQNEIKFDQFSIPPEELIQLTKTVLVNESGCRRPELLSGPVVGPLTKEAYIKALSGFKIFEGFPDLNEQFYDFRVDIFEQNRVWFTTKPTATHTAKLADRFEPTGKRVEAPPQTCSMKFNEKGEVEAYTIGYVMDRTMGNTGGLGGAFAFFYAIGFPLPFPEGKPWSPSFPYRIFQNFQKITEIFGSWGK